jgi:NitT/TauT family transport system ATP-binding protein
MSRNTEPPRRVDASLNGRSSIPSSRSETDQVAVNIRNVGYTYPTGLKAIAGVDLEIHRGSAIGIIGPSGCGKSTLLSLIASLNSPTSGALSVTGDDGSRHPLAMMFQKDTLHPWLTVRENIRLFARFHRKERQAIDDRISEFVALARLDGFEDAYPYQLSGGMRRRVALLAAVIPLPQLLLLDEPFSSLDEPTRLSIHQDFLGILHRIGMTVILVTHDLAEAISLCDEIVIMGPRPGTVVSRHNVPFGRDRDILSLRQTPEYLALYGTLWHDLSEQIKNSTVT